MIAWEHRRDGDARPSSPVFVVVVVLVVAAVIQGRDMARKGWVSQRLPSTARLFVLRATDIRTPSMSDRPSKPAKRSPPHAFHYTTSE